MAFATAFPRNKPDSYGIAEGALFADLTILVVLIGLYVPYAGPALAAISPIPLLLLALRRGWRVTTEATIVACLLVSFFAGPFSAVPVLTIAFRSAALAIGLRQGWSARKTVLAGGAFLWLVVWVGVTLLALLLPSWRAATEQGISLTLKEGFGLVGVVLRTFGQGHLWHSIHAPLNNFTAWFVGHWLELLPFVAWPVLLVAVAAEYVIAEVVLPRFGITPPALRLLGMQATPAADQAPGLRARVRVHLESQLALRQEELRERRASAAASKAGGRMQPIPQRAESEPVSPSSRNHDTSSGD